MPDRSRAAEHLSVLGVLVLTSNCPWLIWPCKWHQGAIKALFFGLCLYLDNLHCTALGKSKDFGAESAI